MHDIIMSNCYSRATSDKGLGHRFSEGEICKYKREWEKLDSLVDCHGLDPGYDATDFTVLRAYLDFDILNIMLKFIYFD